LPLTIHLKSSGMLQICWRLLQHLGLWFAVIGVEVGARQLLKHFGPGLFSLDQITPVERYLGWLTVATLVVSATSMAGEVMAVTIQGLILEATLLAERLRAFVYEIRKFKKGT
jgi:hypothetical protein